MAPTKPPYHIDLAHIPTLVSKDSRSASSTAASSPTEQSATTSAPRQSQGTTATANSLASINYGSVNRNGTGSPSHEFGGRLYPRRAREIQASESSNMHQIWGPPTASGLSTPLRETIPESPGDENFSEAADSLNENPMLMRSSSLRSRPRAGTVPSRFPPGLPRPNTSAQTSGAPSRDRPTPSTSPFRPGTASVPEPSQSTTGPSSNTNSFLMSRLRSGSMPQRSNIPTGLGSGALGGGGGWGGLRLRSSTLATAHSDSPPASASLDGGFADSDVKTLGYLGLDDPLPRSSIHNSDLYLGLQQGGSSAALQPLLANLSDTRNANRFRSFSVNAKERYGVEEDDQSGAYYSGTLTPSAEATAAAYAATQAQIRQHNLDVQAFANQTSSSRPRARTAGVLDSPANRNWRGYQQGSQLASSIADLSIHEGEDKALFEALQAMHIPNGAGIDNLSSEEASRSLYLGNIPPSTTSSSIKVYFEPFGKVDSARVLTHKGCGFVNYEKLESAIEARATLNGKEIFPGAGPIRIGFAKAPSASETPGGNGIYSSPSPDPFGPQQSSTDADATGVSTNAGDTIDNGLGPAATLKLHEIREDILDIVQQLGANDTEFRSITAIVDSAMSFDDYETEIPPVPEASQNRMYDAPKLRDIRKRIDNNTCSAMEVEQIALTMLPEIAELSSDYLGNTVVQKLFEFCSEETKEEMLSKIAPHLAEIGVHKNGTWAAQKIINVARTERQMSIIVESLRPYCVPSFLDQYGNYVMQGCLRFLQPWNNFVFEAMLSRLWELAQGRFGARAVRACLESHHASNDQKRLLAAVVALHSVQLATNANGALLLTWFLDTCNFPRRRTVLAPRLIPHLVHLCTHKLAYLTVLKIINQRNEPEAKDMILRALFYSEDDRVLEAILRDQSYGATLIFKILTTPFFEENMRAEVVQIIKKVLLKLGAQPAQGYKRLMDEVGLSTRNGGSGGGSTSRERSSPAPKHRSTPSSSKNHGNKNGNNSSQATPSQSQPPPPFNPLIGQPITQNGGMDSPGHFGQMPAPSMNNHAFASNGMPMGPGPITPQTQMQYQQAMRSVSGPMAFAPSGMNGFPSQGGNMDAFRGMPRNGIASPPPFSLGNGVIQPAGFAPQAGFNPMMMGPNSPAMWQQYQNPYMMSPPQMPGSPAMGASVGGGRRGRR